MIKAASISTNDVDDINRACLDLAKQLGEKLTLLANNVGIVQCSPDFIEAGILEPLHRVLNIPLVGGTTVASATNDDIGNTQFSMLVLTSDDVEFVVSHTSGLADDYLNVLKESFTGTFSQQPLKLVIVFPPILDFIAGDSYIEAIESVCGKVPVFGANSIDDKIDNFVDNVSICNGKSYKTEMTYVMLFGNVNPRFSLATVPKQSNLTESDAIITKAQGNIVYEINHMRAIDYFENIGIAISGKFIDGAIFIPLLMSFSDNPGEIPFVRALVRTDADGSVIFRGKIIEGARFSFGSYFSADVLSSTSETLISISQEENVSAALLFSCLIRQLVIGVDSMRELSMVKETLMQNIPFIASYVGGEISPTNVDENNIAQNRYHSYTFITCLL